MLPVFMRLSSRDTPTAPNWMEIVYSKLNLVLEGTITSLGNLTIGENVQGMKYTTTFTTLSDYTSGGFIPILFNYTGVGQPSCLVIGRVVGVTPLNPISINSWALNTARLPSQVSVNYIAGLSNSTKYTITFLFL